MAQEKLQATIPSSNKWHTEDIEAKAKQLGMEKSEFILNAVNMMMNFDEVFYKKIKGLSNSLHCPDWLVIQNTVIDKFSKDAALNEVYGPNRRVLHEFISTNEGIITGEQLFNHLKQFYVDQEKKTIK